MMVSLYNCHATIGFLNAVSIVKFILINPATSAGVLGVRVLSVFLLKVLCGLTQLYIKIVTASLALKYGILHCSLGQKYSLISSIKTKF